MPVTAAEAMNFVTGQNAKIRHPLPEFLKRQSKPVYIYNVGKKSERVSMGGMGYWQIYACEEGKAFSRPCVVPGVFGDEYDLGDGQGNMQTTPVAGQELAEGIIGVHSTSRELGTLTTNREWWGVFIPEKMETCKNCGGDTELREACEICYKVGAVPSQADLAKATAKLHQYMQMWIRDGDRLALQGPNGLAHIEANHREAVRYENQRRGWAEEIRSMDECPACGSAIKPGVAMCPDCNAILDMEKARIFWPDKFSSANVPAPSSPLTSNTQPPAGRK